MTTLAQRAKALFTRGTATPGADAATIVQPTGPLSPVIEAFPDSLTELDQWVLWRSEHGTKRPYCAATGNLASTTRPDNWATFEAARAEYEAHPGRYAGFGFVFSGDDGLTGIDLDDCILADGSYKYWAQRILSRLESYSEVSPSGTGIKIWVRGKLTGGGKQKTILKTGHLTSAKHPPGYDGAVEMYDRGRYFAVTGHRVGIFDIEDCQAEIDQLYAILARPDNAPNAPTGPAGPKLIPAEIGPGNRHNELTSIAGAMWRNGLGGEEIRAALLVANQTRCKPPKSDRDINVEIEGIIKFLQTKPQGVLPTLPRERGTEPALVPDTPSETAVTPIYVLPLEQGDKPFPNDIARVLMETHKFLVYKDMVFEYDGRRWEQISKSRIAQYALSLDTHNHTTRKRRMETVNYILDSATNDRIVWRQLADLEVPVRNGVVNIDTCEIRPHRPLDYLESVIPHDYDPHQAPHVWLKTLDRWFDGDLDRDPKIDALQEFFGYCLLPHARYKKALFLHGESNTGKSQVPLVLKALVGLDNICTLGTEQMADERKRASIVGKMVNLMTELPVDAMIADGGFKQLVSTGDPISIDPKYVAPFSYVPFCKHVVCTNNLPEIQDQSAATFNRLLLLKFNNVIPAHEQDDTLIDKLTGEIGGILAWSIEGAARLVQNRGRFTEIEESDKAVKEYRESQNPVNDFIEEHCYKHDPETDGEITDEWCITTEAFHDRFAKWYTRPISRKATKRMVESAGFTVKQKKMGAKNLRTILGLAWSD